MKKQRQKTSPLIFLLMGIVGLLACAVIAFTAWSAINNPAFVSLISAPVPTQENLWAQVDIAKPQPISLNVNLVAAPDIATTPMPPPVDEPTTIVTDLPTSIPEFVVTASPPAPTQEPPTVTPEITETPGTLAMEIVADTPTSEYIPPPTSSAPNPGVIASGNGGRWIDVNLSTQSVYAYEGDTVVNSFIVSTGTSLHPTVTGRYKIYVKYQSANMSGPGYFLPDVPYVMYFYKGYGLHGTYWHHNFGTPMSHGCINLETGNAGWLFNWASVGTVVNVHY